MELTVSDLQVMSQRRVVLDAVSFAVPAGQLTVVVGANGAGKSTLLRVLAGLDKVSRGSVLLDGRQLHSLTNGERARALAHLPQTAAIHWAVSGRDVVALGRLPHGASISGGRIAAADLAAVARAMALTETTEFATRRVDRLSIGERARLLLARVLATEAPILLLDEPVASLDPAQAMATLQALTKVACEGTAILVVMHDLVLAQRFADCAVVLKRGRVIAQGEATRVFDAVTLRDAFGIEFESVTVGGKSLLFPSPTIGGVRAGP